MLSVYSIERSEQWDAVVRSFREFDAYWLSGYVKTFQIHGDGEPLLFLYEGSRTRAINVVMKRDVAKDVHFKGKIPEGQYFDFATPYGYGGWIIEGENTEELFTAYENWILKNKIISEFIRFHPMLKNHEKCKEYYDVIKLGEVIHMDLSSPEIIWNNLAKVKRNRIRKAIKSGIRIYNGRFPTIFEKFREIYNRTMDMHEAEEYYYFKKEFYDSILNDLSQNSQIFWAEMDGKVIAASLIISANGRMNYHLSGSLREYGVYAPGSLIIYKAALWGCVNGYKTFYLGGGVASGVDSLFKFKRTFYKGRLNHFYIGKKIYNQEKYNILLNIREEVIESPFFPQYRA